MLPTEMEFRLARIGCRFLHWTTDYRTRELFMYCDSLAVNRCEDTSCLLENCPIVTEKLPKQKETKKEVKPYNPTKYVAHFDGSATPNPGLMKIGGFIKDDKGDVIEQYSLALGHGTNNQAEYKSLKHLVNILTQYHPEAVEIYGDSLLVVNQINGVYKVSDPELKKIHGHIMQQLALIPHWKILHVPREKNKDADRLT